MLILNAQIFGNAASPAGSGGSGGGANTVLFSEIWGEYATGHVDAVSGATWTWSFAAQPYNVTHGVDEIDVTPAGGFGAITSQQGATKAAIAYNDQKLHTLEATVYFNRAFPVGYSQQWVFTIEAGQFDSPTDVEVQLVYSSAGVINLHLLASGHPDQASAPIAYTVGSAIALKLVVDPETTPGTRLASVYCNGALVIGPYDVTSSYTAGDKYLGWQAQIAGDGTGLKMSTLATLLFRGVAA